jgi:hypothetical protein
MSVWDVTVWCTTARPIQVDAQQAFFRLVADTQMEAEILAVDILMWTRPFVQMPTRIQSVKVS